jgi:hypothetical protein
MSGIASVTFMSSARISNYDQALDTGSAIIELTTGVGFDRGRRLGREG